MSSDFAKRRIVIAGIKGGITKATALAALLVIVQLFFAQSTFAQKVPPMEISSEFPYESRFVEILGSQMHYVEKGEGDPVPTCRRSQRFERKENQ